MEKIKRYAGLKRSMYLERDEGEVCFYEDHLAALREIFPDWPGEYPAKTGIYFFRTRIGEIQPVYFCKDLCDENDSFYALAILQRMNAREISRPDQWGPLWTPWRKV